MRAQVEARLGSLAYVFTTFGHIYVGVLDAIIDDVVRIVLPDGRTELFVNLTDISGVRVHDDDPGASA